MLREHFKFTPLPREAGGSHEKWEGFYDGLKRKVTLDCHRGEVRELDVKSIIGQIGCKSKEFWRAVERC